MKKCLVSINKNSWEREYLLIPEKLLGDLMQCPIYRDTYVKGTNNQFILQKDFTLDVKIIDEDYLQTDIIPAPEEVEPIAEAA